MTQRSGSSSSSSGEERGKRDVLRGIAIAIGVATAGCSGRNEEDTDPSNMRKTAEPDTSEATTTAATRTESATETTESPQIPTGTLNLVPRDENAEYADAEVFNMYNGETTVEVNLNTAWNQTHGQKFEAGDNLRRAEGDLTEFLENYRDPQWRQDLVSEVWGDGRGDPLDTNTLESASNLKEFIQESGLQELYHTYQNVAFSIGGVSSNNGDIQSAIYQEIANREKENGNYSEDVTFVCVQGNNLEHGGHNLIYAPVNPAEPDGAVEDQEVYVIETVTSTIHEQVAEVRNSNIVQDHRTGENIEIPFEEDATNASNSTLADIPLYDDDMYRFIFTDEMTQEYDSRLRNPSDEALKPFMDAAAVSGYLCVQHPDITVSTSMEKMEANR